MQREGMFAGKKIVLLCRLFRFKCHYDGKGGRIFVLEGRNESLPPCCEERPKYFRETSRAEIKIISEEIKISAAEILITAEVVGIASEKWKLSVRNNTNHLIY